MLGSTKRCDLVGGRIIDGRVEVVPETLFRWSRADSPTPVQLSREVALDVHKINAIKALQLLKLADSIALVKDLITPGSGVI